MKLYELQDKMPLPCRIVIGKDKDDEIGIMTDCTIHHLDGMYSYCYVDEDQSKVFHLSISTPMVERDGRWEIEETNDK